ncbi:2-oxo-4-hydroxy-4-carboxy-5-ureidoimidazoline decarboxylase [Henriciella sp. AS95]|uniref:2-oxo-4-hydroxy-4-carboxy-5-ureidoimidazoline decarboxylase n=1 Tax=Henriciella sp. AS95 TaxID=3135782 RepID=UPI003174B719
MTIDDVNAMDRSAFIEAFGDLYEHSPWIVAESAERGPFKDRDHLQSAMTHVVETAGEDRQLSLLRAHPELAGKAAMDKTLTDASTAEQASAGLDRMTPAEYEEFHALNAAYRERFDFPFIICVRLTDKPGILRAMRERLQNDRETEFRTALDEVSKIVGIRLEEIMS